MRINNKASFVLCSALVVGGCASSAGVGGFSSADQAFLDGIGASNGATTELLKLYRTCLEMGGNTTPDGRACFRIAEGYGERIERDYCELMDAAVLNGSVLADVRKVARLYVEKNCRHTTLHLKPH